MMKKIILMAACAMLGMGAATAQVQLGAKVGFDLTNFWGKDVSHGMQPNYQAGLTLEYRFANTNFALAPEVVFAAQGGKNTTTKEASSLKAEYDETYHTNYINVPVMLKYYVAPAFSIDFGPQVGFNVYSKVTKELKGSSGDKTTSTKKTNDLKDATKTVDFGLGLGGTYNLTSNAYVQARYTMGMTNVFDGDVECKNGNIQIAFGMKF